MYVLKSNDCTLQHITIHYDDWNTFICVLETDCILYVSQRFGAVLLT